MWLHRGLEMYSRCRSKEHISVDLFICSQHFNKILFDRVESLLVKCWAEKKICIKTVREPRGQNAWKNVLKHRKTVKNSEKLKFVGFKLPRGTVIGTHLIFEQNLPGVYHWDVRGCMFFPRINNHKKYACFISFFRDFRVTVFRKTVVDDGVTLSLWMWNIQNIKWKLWK